MNKPLPKELTGDAIGVADGTITQGSTAEPLPFDPKPLSIYLRDVWPDVALDPHGYRHYVVMPYADLEALVMAHAGMFLPPVHFIRHWRVRDPTLQAADIAPRLRRERQKRDAKDILRTVLLVLFGAACWAAFHQ